MSIYWLLNAWRYSYNEIHNRRVALGITCIQCTPVQLELLRRAGAMPVSSRRCGMITRREAERLVRSFLDDAAPPKLPDDFVFDVEHSCGWGCRGAFIPSRYNRFSSLSPACTCVSFLPARRSKRGICYGNVAGWLAGWISHDGIVSKRLNLS